MAERTLRTVDDGGVKYRYDPKRPGFEFCQDDGWQGLVVYLGCTTIPACTLRDLADLRENPYVPTVTRVRKVPLADGGGFIRWNVDEDKPEYRTTGGRWVSLCRPLSDYPPEWIRAVADVKENPTEEVEA